MRDAKTISMLHKFFGDDPDAVQLALMLTRISDVWDDLIDKDAEVTPADINNMMWLALSGVNRNAFFRNHTSELLPLMETSILNWMASDELKANHGQKGVEIANVIRHSLCDLFVHMARIIGGFEWAVSVTPEIRMLAQNDSLDEFVKG